MKRRSIALSIARRVPPAWLLTLTLALACIGSNANAQEIDAPYYDGTWTVRMRCADGSVCSARLVLHDFDGTWQNLSGKSAAARACGGKKMPVTIQSSTRSLLAITAFGDVVSPTCPTLTIVVKPVDAKTLEGTVDTDANGAESPEVHAAHSGPPKGAEAAPAPGGGAKSARPICLERR